MIGALTGLIGFQKGASRGRHLRAAGAFSLRQPVVRAIFSAALSAGRVFPSTSRKGVVRSPTGRLEFRAGT